jgi:hypothetical protein
MADRATQVINFYETTLSGLLASAGTSATVATSPGVNASLGDEDTWFYLVIDPDNSGNREVVVVKTSTGTSFSLIERDLENDYAGSPPDHQSGTTVRMAVLAQHIDDQNDRVAGILTEGQAAIDAITAASATAMMEGATDGTSITVDNANDYILVYDNDTTTAKQVNLSQLNLGASVGLVLALGG